MKNAGGFLRHPGSLRWVLLAWNCASIAIGLWMFLGIKSMPPTVPAAIAYATKDLSREEVATQLIKANQEIDHVFFLFNYALGWWLLTASVNLIAWLSSSYWGGKKPQS
jgi:hypothetical protein